MKRKNVFTIIILSIITVSVVSKEKKENLSDIALANIEALATNESIYDYRQPETVACDYIEGIWHTASVQRDCVFCAVPSFCTPVECGEVFYN